MPIRIICPSCASRLNAPEAFAGRKIKCPTCQTVVSVPKAEEPASAPADAVVVEELEELDALEPPPPRSRGEEKKAPRARPKEDEDEEEKPSAGKRKKPAKVEEESVSDEDSVLADRRKFVVKAQTKMLSSKKTYEIVDADGGEVLALATPKSGFLAMIFGLIRGKDKKSVTIEVRQKSGNALLFSVRRSGFLFTKIQALDGRGKVVGLYKAKRFSLSGGFHVYDKAGKHFAEIKGKMLKAEYKFVTPDGKEEMGSVSRTWGGMARELFKSAGTYGVEISPEYADDMKAKILILGASIAIDALFKKAGGKKGEEEGDDDGGGGGDD
jgi:uncharacterized protein YxjI